jgi:hypothetical protein
VLAACYLLSRGLSARLISRPWRWTQYFPPKRRLACNGLHGVISQNIELLIIKAKTQVTVRPWRWRRYVPPKRRLAFNALHGVISQKIELLIIKAKTHKSLFDPEDGGDMFLRNVDWLSMHYTAYIQEDRTLDYKSQNTQVTVRPWRWRRYLPPKRRLTFNALHGVISQKIELLIIKANTHKSLFDPEDGGDIFLRKSVDF